MSFLDDIPFDGDTSTPIEEIKLKKKAHVQLSYRDRYSLSGRVTPAQQTFYHYLAQGNLQARLEKEQQAYQAELNRQLLEVEIEALKKRQSDKNSQLEKVNAVHRSIDLMLEKQLDNTLNNYPLKYFADSRDMGHFKRIFSVLGDDRLSVSGLESAITPCKWLADKFVFFCNSSDCRSHFANQESKDLKQATNFLNVKGITALIPVFLVEQKVALQKDFLKQPWSRFRRFAYWTALSALFIGRREKRNDLHIVFLLAYLSVFAELMLFSLLSSVAKDVQQDSIYAASKRQSDFRVKAIESYQPSGEITANLMQLIEPSLHKIIDALHFNYIPAAQIFDSQGDEHQALRNIMSKAKAFTQYKMLSIAKMDEREDILELLKLANMDNATMQFLRAQDYNAVSIFHALEWIRKA
ncbi:hypothetical protein DS2_02835 [Catenovulum agarivorans DS-2]|uniref:HDOD domain-containing protein n=1 Tax=Catenovulum agarivorans DS-2 TaxID=1328313 RepID=W7QFN1_9ALTE|nr:hypothetical protein [Catenovulum agarivorans]EWH11724.1 hypothetical protein DS2_02835 [Catenovulum agarivorans DS-2]